MNLKHLSALYEGLRTDQLIVCHIDDATAAALGARHARVLLSDDTMRKQRAHHTDLVLEHYTILPALLRSGEYRQDCASGAVIIYTDTVRFSCNFRAYVKVCHRGNLWLTSFNLLRDRQMAKERRKPHPIIRQHD
jgi:hypothetical protein